jgi:hypothetical protein
LVVITFAGIIRRVELCKDCYGYILAGHSPESALCPQGGEASQE